MKREPLLFTATSDVSGKTRGKAFPAAKLEARAARGVGWTPTNVQITCFDVIADSPYGAFGDLLLVPDTASLVEVDFGDGAPGEAFMLGDIVTTEGTPWECCTRSILKAALERLHRVAGLQLLAAFEHEFQLRHAARPLGDAYSLRGYRAAAAFAQTLMAALHAAGLEADTVMKEYGVDQYEVTVEPELGLRAADASVIVREMVYASALRHDDVATFTPIRDPAEVGNGLHIHMSFRRDDGEPATFDAAGPHGLSPQAGSFAAGVLKYLDSIVALTAPSAVSYLRLVPHRWSAAYNNLGYRDREASLRICPVSARDPRDAARQLNIEFRAGDSAASPHLALAAVVHAGVQGVEEGLAPPEVTQEDLSLLDERQLAARGLTRLPQSLDEALTRFAGNETVRGWFPGKFCDVYVAHKRGELAYLENMTVEERCAAYEIAY